ncbi:hypothetical protein JW960_28365 [candidate division KSB1 bacterium]|nr:hypothetical protein [candidate division KSB1 bacterium]
MFHHHLKYFIIFLLLATSVFAQDKSNVAVMELDAAGISPAENKIISARLRTDLFNTGKFNILEREKMEDILTEQGFQMSGCTSDECAVEIGRLIGVKKIVAGSIGKLGSIYTLNIRLIDVETGAVERTATEDCQCPIEDVLTQAINRAARKLAGEQISSPKIQPTLPAQTTVDQSQPTPRPQPIVTNTQVPKKKGTPIMYMGLGFGQGTYKLQPANFDFLTFENSIDLKPTVHGYTYYQLPLNLRLGYFFKIHTIDNQTAEHQYTGKMFLHGPSVQFHFLSWFYLSWNIAFQQLQFERQSVLYSTDYMDVEPDKKSLNGYAVGLEIPLHHNFRLAAEFMSFENYVTSSYGVVLVIDQPAR